MNRARAVPGTCRRAGTTVAALTAAASLPAGVVDPKTTTAMTEALDTQQNHAEIEQAISKEFPHPSMDAGPSVGDAAARGQVT
jgi:hypothetical protein